MVFKLRIHLWSALLLWGITGYCSMASAQSKVSIADPENGAYVSGVYEIVLQKTGDAEVLKTAFFVDDRRVFIGEGWVERFMVDFGENIERHELYAIVEFDKGERIRSEDTVTKRLRVDFSYSSKLILLSVVVKSRNDKVLADLPKSKFTVMENGESLNIESFYREEVPLDLALLLDCSSSLTGEGIVNLRNAATKFVSNLTPADRLALYEFKKEAKKLVDFSTDHKAHHRKIGEMTAGGMTALFDCLFMGLRDLEHRPRGKKVLILFTDGQDNTYKAKEKARMIREAIATAQNKEIVIFTIGLGDTVNRDMLRKMAEETGGLSYFVNDSRKLPKNFASLILDLRNQYMLGVTPKASGSGFRSLEVEVSKRGAQVFCRKGYTVE